MTQPSTGQFHAVGVGPGDPELLTLKALRLIQRAQVICHAGPAQDRGRALDIVRGFLKPEQECRTVLADPMQSATAASYLPAIERIAADCTAGRAVVFITEGDPTLYSTAAHVWQLLRELHPEIAVQVVPGVSSITAAAARVGWPLAQKDEPLLIVPAHYHADKLSKWLKEFPRLCLLKPTAALPELTRLIGEQHDAVYLEEATTDREWLTHDLHEASTRQHYFSLVLLRARCASKGKEPFQDASQGSIAVVGIGPGDPSLLTQQARSVLEAAEVIIGYASYLDLLGELNLSGELRAHPIGAEGERARETVELARNGKRVALVSSGDAGIYGMASLLLEAAEAYPNLQIDVVPGVTAATSAAALLGAPLGHDFACISLSDLLTPWEVIEQRLAAAAQADFVIALYNPVSKKRTWQLPKAREILLKHRGRETPVGFVDRAHRPGMTVRTTPLAGLVLDGIGMETVVLIGNSQTRLINGRLVTPRGYGQASGGRKPAVPTASDPALLTAGLRPPLARNIIDQSFAIIDSELGAVDLPPWARAVVRRMIHASADFDFARTLRWSADFPKAIRQAYIDRRPVVTDVEMVALGIRTVLASVPEMLLSCQLNDAETRQLADSAGLTRSAAGIRIVAAKYPSPLLVIGNAPTALDEALRLTEEDGWRPAAIVGMPVGFVGVEEAKGRLLEQSRVPYLTCEGRKGGSAVAAAAMNALIEWQRSLTAR
jgi:precorrin-2 C(20)-methyltransferase